MKVKIPKSTKTRCMQHLHAKMRTGAGVHKTIDRNPPPEMDEWDYEDEEEES